MGTALKYIRARVSNSNSDGGHPAMHRRDSWLTDIGNMSKCSLVFVVVYSFLLLLLLYSSCLVCKHPPHPRYIQNDRWRSESMLKITHCCSCLFGASGNMITVIILLIRGTYHSLECKYSARVIVSHQQNTTYSICTELSCWYYYFQRMNMFFLFLIHHSSWLVT